MLKENNTDHNQTPTIYRIPFPCILISGAAAGIGAATARYFAQRGWVVGVYDWNESGVQALARELGSSAIAGKLDVGVAADWNVALQNFFNQTGRLDVLMNNAGLLESGPFEQIPLERQQKLLQVNVLGVLNGCHQAFPWLRQTPGAQVVNMASASALYGQPSLASYSASKCAVRGLTEALNLEWQRFGIYVLDILPLFVQTGMIQDMQAVSLRSLGVHLQPEDVATVIWKAVHARPAKRRVHWCVGRQAELFYSVAGLLPDRMVRWINDRIAVAHQ